MHFILKSNFNIALIFQEIHTSTLYIFCIMIFFDIFNHSSIFTVDIQSLIYTQKKIVRLY